MAIFRGILLLFLMFRFVFSLSSSFLSSLLFSLFSLLFDRMVLEEKIKLLMFDRNLEKPLKR